MAASGVRAAAALTTAALALAPIHAAADPQKVGNWTFEVVSDPITDQQTGRAWVDAPEGRVFIKCDKPGSGTVYAAIAPDRPLGYEGPELKYPDVVWRADKGEPVDQQWKFFNDVGFTQSRQDAQRFMDAIAMSEHLAIRVFDYEGQPVDMAFDTNGAAEAEAKVISVCSEETASGLK